MKKILYLDRGRIDNCILMEKVVKTISEKIKVINQFEEDEIGKALRNQKFDLIVSDTHCVNGKKIIKHLRDGDFGELNRSTPAIAYTAISLHDEEKKCMEIGFNKYILVPDILELKKEIEKFLYQKP